MYDIIFIGPKDSAWKRLKTKFITAKHANDFAEAKRKSLTSMFWAVCPDVEITDDFNFSYIADQWSLTVPHVFRNGQYFDGVCLFPKDTSVTEQELQTRLFNEKKEVDIVASNPVKYSVFNIDTYEQYLEANENSLTEFFYVVWNDVVVDYDFTYQVPYWNKYTHVFKNDKDFDGICIFNKHTIVSRNEFNTRFFITKHEVDIVASIPMQYDYFEVNTYEDYQAAFRTAKTEMFWIVPNDVEVSPSFKFDLYFTHHNAYDRKINHVFKNGEHYDGIILYSKIREVSRKEFEFRFLANKKEWDIVASNPKPYDIVFISYNEPNADENFENLKERFPRAKRIHGVKGIHNAHIEAAKLCNTDMFWIVDGDAIIVDDFIFDYHVPSWDKNTVHVWRSINPINELVYGYGGIKLFPTKLTINMDTSRPDMTTSISSRFKAKESISNITAFNTDAFSTWKSAYRECCKLASKVIDRQNDTETDERLQVWCTVGEDKKFGKYALAGAKAGAAYGARNRTNVEALRKINDFDWLQEQFNGNI